LLLLAWLPAGLILGCFLLALLLFAHMSMPVMIPVLQKIFQGPRSERGERRGLQFDVHQEDTRHWTVRVRGYLVGTLTDEDEVWLRTRREGDEIFLRHGENITQGGLVFRPPRYPWRWVLLTMVAWSLLLLLFFPA